jgi:predicted branched-subunit amino acid permease
MPISSPSKTFLRGAVDSIPFLFIAGPFGLLFGVLAGEAGLDPSEALAFSLAVFAGAAQFTALQLLQEHAPTFIVLASSFAVNLRMAMSSASLTPYLGAAPMWQRVFASYLLVDQSYALSSVKFETTPDMTTRQRVAYFFGTNALITPLWMIMTYSGARFGTAIPDSIALDFALPIAFLAMVGPMMRTPAHMVAAFVACLVAVPAAWMPFNLGLIVAGLAGMMAGARAELFFEHRKALLAPNRIHPAESPEKKPADNPVRANQ